MKSSNEKKPTRMTLIQDAARKFISEVHFPVMRLLWCYPKDKLSQGWNLQDLYERVSAAQTLGWQVAIYAEERGLVVKYVKKPEYTGPDL